MSPQSRCSLASHFKMTQEEFMGKMTKVFQDWGVFHFFDVSFARELSLLESAKEFLRRKKEGGVFPMLASACPGWIAYSESTHGDYVLPYISTTKSPQQIMGTLVKRYFTRKIDVSPSKIFHTTIMPCLDKRVEASRDQFYDKELDTHDVDFVLTTKDVLQLLQEKVEDFAHKQPVQINQLFTNIENGKFYSAGGGPSDGFLEYIFKMAAQELYNLPIQKIHYTITGKSTDFKETSLIVDGKEELRFAVAYGFRNIQTIVRQIKRGNCPYHFVEVMACPSGCTNGGGQIEPEDTGTTPQQLLDTVNDLYASQPVVEPGSRQVLEVYSDWIKNDELAKEFLHTNYSKVELIKPKTKTGCKCASSATNIW